MFTVIRQFICDGGRLYGVRYVRCLLRPTSKRRPEDHRRYGRAEAGEPKVSVGVLARTPTGTRTGRRTPVQRRAIETPSRREESAAGGKQRVAIAIWGNEQEDQRSVGEEQGSRRRIRFTQTV